MADLRDELSSALGSTVRGWGDPLNKVLPRLADQMLATGALELKQGNRELANELRGDIKQMTKDGEDPEIIAKYKRMLDGLTL